MRSLRTAIILASLLLLVTAGWAAAQTDDDPYHGGSLVGTVNGKQIAFPALFTEIEADVKGDVATVTVRQIFANPGREPMHAEYLFPLNHQAAVYGMTMQVGQEVVEAVIKKKKEAEQIFETAKSQGKSASLLTQHRPNMFTQKVANLMPGLPVMVEIDYVQDVPLKDGEYSLVIPLVVGPRYVPEKSHTAKIASDYSLGTKPAIPVKNGKWELEELPAYPPVRGLQLPTSDDPRVSINVRIDGGVNITDVGSPSHKIAVNKHSESVWEVELKKGAVPDNKDFILSYSLFGDTISARTHSHMDDRGGFFSFMITPPELPATDQISPREVVFVLDCSGSMHGPPIEAAKGFMVRALKDLRPGDHFRIVTFNNEANEFSTSPMPAEKQNVQMGIRFVKQLHATGGTEMKKGMTRALRVPPASGVLRIVVFLTDGYIGNEGEVLSTVNGMLGNARIFALGVGNSVNRYLLEQMVLEGRGLCKIMLQSDNPSKVAKELAEKIKTPVLTDISIDWGSTQPFDVYPEKVTDLFAGRPVVIHGKFSNPGIYDIKINGKIAGKSATLPLQIELGQGYGDNEAVALSWARAAIADTMRKFNSARLQDDVYYSHEAHKDKVTNLGLEYSLMTQWTSFVAVSRKVVNSRPAITFTKPVPIPMVDGVTSHAYGMEQSLPAKASEQANKIDGIQVAMADTASQTSTHSSTGLGGFGGTDWGATPEPATMAGIIMGAAAGLAALGRRRKLKS